MTELRAEALRVDLGGRTVVQDLSLAARGGEVLGLIGPNGAGKSTALRAIARLGPMAGGRVLLDGEDIRRLSARALARRLAYLPQGHVVNWPITVERLVSLGRLPHRGPLAGPSAADVAATERAMARAEVTRFRDRAAPSLSGGERARAMLARALAVEAPILLADEPVASLDPYHQLQVMELLRAAAGAGDLVIVVLHDLALAARFCDRLALISEGRLIATGPPDEVLDQRLLAEAYGVQGLRGEHETEFYVLPWRRLGAEDRAATSAADATPPLPARRAAEP